ncbi:MAG: MFS transporter [Parabacteroides sp.]|nr:MFS transporter [Parabacteroides sp.]
MNKKIVLIQLIPILFAFFVMGFVDVVGISTSYVKEDFDLSDTLSNLLPMMVFIWFAVCSLPTGLIMNRIGRKNMVLISIAITLLAMLLPVFEYSYVIVLMSFVLLGIGNTILQVSLNPLLLDVVSEDKVASMLTLGQFIKAISSMLGPVIATLAVSLFGDWHLIFWVYAFVSLLSGLWLIFTPINEKNIVSENSSFAQVISLLKEREMIMSFSVILLIVGFEIGLMTAVPKYFAERCGLPISEGSLGCSVYFAARMLGTFLGTFILAKYSPRKFLMWNIIVAIVALAVFLMLSHIMTMMVLLFVIGLTCANVFPIIFSEAIKSRPDKANEVSSLMIMGVAGGAILPFIMGVIADTYNQSVSILVPLFALIYILFVSFVLKKKV